jgi:hypothetical protein
MQPARQVIREFRWNEIFPGLMLVRVFRSSVRIHALVLSLIATILILQGWRVSALTILPLDHPIRLSAEMGEIKTPYDVMQFSSLHEVGPEQLGMQFVVASLKFEFDRFVQPVFFLFSPRSSYAERFYLVVGFAWSLLVGAFFAGVICRTAAFDLTSQNRYGVFRAMRYVIMRMRSYLGAPLIPLLVLLGMLVPLFLLGLCIAYVSTFLASLAWGAALIWGLVAAVCAVVTLFGWPLLWPALSCEDSDSFDALGSTFGYVSQRPFTYLVYALFGGLIVMLGFALLVVITKFSAALLQFGIISGAGPDASAPFFGVSDAEFKTATDKVISFWTFFSSHLLEGYLFSAFWTLATGVFLLLRYHVDGAELDDIYREGAEDEKPMPKLAREMGLTGEAASMTSPVAPGS